MKSQPDAAAMTLDARGRRIAIVSSRFNQSVVGGLLDGSRATLLDAGIDEADMPVFWVPGAFEIPLVAQRLAQKGTFDAIVCLGAVIKGETAHFEYISSEVAAGLLRVSLDTGIPCAFGVLTCYTQEQAVARSTQDEHNKGIEAACAVLDTLGTLDRINTI
ncbi:MAG: 6,7-dimethyl-8-ribityllumazine synthase [Bacteroidetes bacterium]|nr:6,7-dimethyl-8-ribityllumazine synthase [Bacteroidota bacterium]